MRSIGSFVVLMAVLCLIGECRACGSGTGCWPKSKKIPDDDESWLKAYVDKPYRLRECDRSFKDLLNQLMIPEENRAEALNTKPIAVLEHIEGKKYNIKQKLGKKTSNFKFELGVYFRKNTENENSPETQVTQKKNVLTQTEVWFNEENVVQFLRLTRTYTEKELTYNYFISPTTSVCVYEAV